MCPRQTSSPIGLVYQPSPPAVEKWIAQPGPVEYDYRRLSSAGAESDMKKFGARRFEKIYGVHPDDIEIL